MEKKVQQEVKTEIKTEIKTEVDTIKPKIAIKIEKEFLYDKDTLADIYPYQQTTRQFQWDKIRKRLAWLDSIQEENTHWAILQNYKNLHGEAKIVKNSRKDEYNQISDSQGTERYQSVPLYSPTDTITPLLYGRDGSLVKFTGTDGNFIKIETVYFDGNWEVPEKYVKLLDDTVVFRKAIFVDRENQNLTTLEKVNTKWLVRSMTKATTGLHKPPYERETPLGIFVIQEKKEKMIYNKDGSNETAGFSPYASRFSNGGYIHGIPVNGSLNAPLIENSPSLGTTPRSHMCVRTITSHAKFIYDWGTIGNTVVFVLD
ncbi:MAG: L,D-transpeptidase [Eubacterium sp.]|jgi:hypothetical protein|nr:L,D-transpeptidase [Eubacterium sp.]